jgi:hypothetical protein
MAFGFTSYTNFGEQAMSDKLNIANEMRCLDSKDRNFYDSLTDEERKKFSNFLMIRWSSSIQGSSELQEYYLIACNERLNKHFFDINKHPKLQWLCATSISPWYGQSQTSVDITKEERKRQQRSKEDVDGVVSCNESR